MRKIISSTYISLDGVIEEPQNWTFPYFDDDAGALAGELLAASDTLLMGRRTYESFVETWPGRDGDFADKINTMRKYVVSTTLEKSDWDNTTVIKDNVVETIAALKQEPGEGIIMYGTGPVAYALMENGLLDELRLWIHPVIVGNAKPSDLLYRDTSQLEMSLVDTKTFGSGVTVLSLRPNNLKQ